MRTTLYVAVFVLLNALVLSFSSSRVGAGQSKNSKTHEAGQAAAHMSKKGSANTNAQWSADPERGWVRANERHKMHEETHAPSGAKPNHGKQKDRVKGNQF
jgi:hypothetical protein